MIVDESPCLRDTVLIGSKLILLTTDLREQMYTDDILDIF